MASPGVLRVLGAHGRQFQTTFYKCGIHWKIKQCFTNTTNLTLTKNWRFRQLFRGISQSEQRSRQQTAKTRLSLFPVLFGLSFFGYKTEKQREYDEAVEKLKKDDRITLLVKKAKLEEQRDEFQKAEAYYHKALDTLQVYEQQERWTPDQVLGARVYIYDGMANLAMSQGHFDKAEILFKKTIQGLLQRGLSKNDNAVIEVSMKLAMMYSVQGKAELAETGYRYCIEEQEKKLASHEEIDEDSVALLGMCTDSYSRHLLSQKKYVQAQAAVEKALRNARKVFPANHPQVAVLLNNLATLSSIQEDYSAAKDYIKQAIDVAAGGDKQDLSVYWCNLGLVCLQMKEHEEARRHCGKALKLAGQKKNKVIQEKAQACLGAANNASTS